MCSGAGCFAGFRLLVVVGGRGLLVMLCGFVWFCCLCGFFCGLVLYMLVTSFLVVIILALCLHVV